MSEVLKQSPITQNIAVNDYCNIIDTSEQHKMGFYVALLTPVIVKWFCFRNESSNRKLKATQLGK